MAVPNDVSHASFHFPTCLQTTLSWPLDLRGWRGTWSTGASDGVWERVERVLGHPMGALGISLPTLWNTTTAMGSADSHWSHGVRGSYWQPLMW